MPDRPASEKRRSARASTSETQSVITAIKQQLKQAHRVSIFVDGKYSFSLTMDQLLDEKLKKGDQLDDLRIKMLKKLSDEGKLKQRALEWLLTRPHSVREFRDYMYRKQAEKDLTEAWIEEFSVKKYLDDESFARWFAENRRRKNKSNRAIHSELMSKGVSSSVIQSIIVGLDQEDSRSDKTEKEALLLLVNKLRKRPRYQDQQKLIQNLLGKGFRYGQIKEALANEEDN